MRERIEEASSLSEAIRYRLYGNEVNDWSDVLVRIRNIANEEGDGYVWHVDPPSFFLFPSMKGKPTHVGGHVVYGDSIEDEWFVVHLIREITKRLPELVAQVWDDDGEFLLIEAACTIPDWLEPETSPNRVFIKDGSLHIIPPSPSRLEEPEPLQLEEALEILWNEDASTISSSETQSLIDFRTNRAAAFETMSLHGAVCSLPIGLGRLLEGDPQLISWAISMLGKKEAWQSAICSTRVPLSSKAVSLFKLRFSRVRYAQLNCLPLEIPTSFVQSANQTDSAAATRGRKLAWGCEILFWALKDYFMEECGLRHKIAFHDEHDSYWQLHCSHHFPEGMRAVSREARAPLNDAMREMFLRYQKTEAYRLSVSRWNHAYQALIRCRSETDSDRIVSQEEHMMDDDDGWLRGADGTVNATLESLRDLQSSCQDPAEDVDDLEDRLRSFFLDDSNYRGVEVGNDFDTSILDPDAFIAQMKDALGLDSSSSSVCSEEASTDWEETREERDAGHTPSGRTIGGGDTTEDSDDDDEFYREYGERLKEELRQGMAPMHPDTDAQREDGKKVSVQVERHFQRVDSSQDLEWKTVENLLASYASQNGLPGPVSNFAGLFNIAVPDPGEEKGEEQAPT